MDANVKKIKFTFKKIINSGHFRAFQKEFYYIKLNGAAVGNIFQGNNYFFYILFHIVKNEKNNDRNPNCDWMNIILKRSFSTVNDAKIFINNNAELICKNYQLKMLSE